MVSDILTDFITDANWVDVFTDWFVWVDDASVALERRYGRWRRRALHLITEQIRRSLLNTCRLIAPDDRLRLVDSVPIQACEDARAARCRSVSGPEYVGWRAAHKAALPAAGAAQHLRDGPARRDPGGVAGGRSVKRCCRIRWSRG